MVQILVALSALSTPVSWEVKAGCLANSTVLRSAVTLYSDERACLAQTTSALAHKYFWGQCTESVILIGHGDTQEECFQSMNGTGGYHQVVYPPFALKEESCFCHAQTQFADAFSSFTCVKEVPAVLAESAAAPLPHTSDGSYVSTTAILIIFLVLPLFLTFAFM